MHSLLGSPGTHRTKSALTLGILLGILRCVLPSPLLPTLLAHFFVSVEITLYSGSLEMLLWRTVVLLKTNKNSTKQKVNTKAQNKIYLYLFCLFCSLYALNLPCVHVKPFLIPLSHQKYPATRSSPQC